MNKKVLLVGLMFMIASCGRSTKSSVIGTWDYSRPIRNQDKSQVTIGKDTKDTKASRIWAKYEAEGLEHFYIKFDEKGILTEYKVGLAMEFDYWISNDTIFTDLGSYYKILSLTSEELKLKKILRGNITTYKKVEVDLSEHERAN